ncbi:alpha/beta hydrolase [Nocardioidaceae bacterium]|nr:alpha/beta hydrolase [Nocardioidaceae bacterium]
MSARGRIAGGLAALGVAGVGVAVGGVARQSRRIAAREGHVEDLGSLRGEVSTVVASDGVGLHVEIDEPDEAATGPTVVLVHGYVLNLDCWHYQRAHLRGRHRVVLYDQRSHGRSDSSEDENATIDQLGDDLHRVLQHAAPDQPVVLVGHSMGGMSIMAYAEEHPEAFGPVVKGVALISTTAGGLTPSKIVVPWLPRRLTSKVADQGVATLARGSRFVDVLRKTGSPVQRVITDHYAFGSDVSTEVLDYVDDMIGQTTFDVISSFFPNFGDLDKYDVLDALSEVPTSIICGTDDKLTSIEHSRTLAEMMPWAELVEVDGAGHMVIMEREHTVDRALDDLLAAVERGEHDATTWRDRLRRRKRRDRSDGSGS